MFLSLSCLLSSPSSFHLGDLRVAVAVIVVFVAVVVVFVVIDVASYCHVS